MNRLFVVNKPIFLSSNNYMYKIKREYGTKKVGFSGTLDPFATGCLIVATGKFTKLFQYLNKTPKRYRATMWIGATSASLDIENIISIKDSKELDIQNIKESLNSLIGTLTYLPPKYSAKKIKGKKAYELARENIDIALKEITSIVYDVKLLNYNHPFVTFEIEVSEGSYIRSIAQILAKRLNIQATLSALHRINEGNFFYNNQEPIDPYKNLKIATNRYLGDIADLELGRKLDISNFEIKEDGEYLVEAKNSYAIIAISKQKVSYKLNSLPKEYN
jgi:tRNA pseudouridine55 synthase